MSALRTRIGDSALAARLRRELQGEVLFDAASRGRYATDASIYQVEPIGVVIPRSEQDLRIAVQIAAEEGIPILPQNLNEAIDAFAADPVMREAIGEKLSSEFIRLKRMEWIEYSRHVSSWEVDRYLEFY